MIGFDEKNANPTKHFEEARGIAKVGSTPKTILGCESRRDRAAWWGTEKARITKFPKEIQRLFERISSSRGQAPFLGAGGEPVAEDGQMLMKREQHSQGSCVIAMFMSEEDPGELLGRSASRQQTRRQLSRAQSGIDEEGGRLVAHEVAFPSLPLASVITSNIRQIYRSRELNWPQGFAAIGGNVATWRRIMQQYHRLLRSV